MLLSAGRFAFVELRTEELATTAMTLDKMELLGRTMNIGRPKGYVPGTSAPGEGRCGTLTDTQPQCGCMAQGAGQRPAETRACKLVFAASC